MSAYEAYSTDTISDTDSPAVETSTAGQGRPKGKRRPDPNHVWDGETELGNARHIWLPAAMACDDRLTLVHWRLMAYVGRQNADRGWVEMSQAKFAERWGYARKSVNNAIRQLVDWGYLEKLPQQEAHNRWCYYKVVTNFKATTEAPCHVGHGVSDGSDPATRHMGDGTSSGTCHAGDGTTCHVADGTSQGPLFIARSDSTDKEDSDKRESARARAHAPQEGADLLGHVQSPGRAKTKRTAPAKVRESTTTCIAADAVLSDQDLAHALSEGLTEQETRDQWDSFVAWHDEKGSAFKDWPRAWREWIKKAKRFGHVGRSGPQRKSKSPGQSSTAGAIYEGTARHMAWLDEMAAQQQPM